MKRHLAVDSPTHALTRRAFSGAVLVSALAVSVGCTPSKPPPPEKAAPVKTSPALPPGQYGIQSISYDDADGAYRVFLLDAPEGHKSLYTTLDLRLARLGAPDAPEAPAVDDADGNPNGPAIGITKAQADKIDADSAAARKAATEAAAKKADAKADAKADGAIADGAIAVANTDAPPPADEKPYLVAGADGSVAHIPETFEIQYTHNVVEERGGQQVVVRHERSTWSPFMSVVAGMAVGNMLFGPRYYYPPPYAGGRMTGYGGAGTTMGAAQQSYQKTHGKLPQATRLSSSGYSKAPSSSKLKSSGKGVGSSRLQKGSKPVKMPKRSFGGGFGRRRR